MQSREPDHPRSGLAQLLNILPPTTISNIEVQVLLFADDIVMVTERKEDTQKNLEVLKAAMEKWEMKMHLGKTEVMVVSRTEE